MLISTALVLLMTPALAFFYGGLVRSKNALNTMMMSFISLGFVGVLWALSATRSRSRPGNNWLGDLSLAFLNGVGLEATGRDRADHDSPRALHGVPGDVLHHHRGADLRRHRRAHALLGVSDLHLPVVGRRLRAAGALGVGRRLAGGHGRLGLRRRHGRARQRRRRGAGGGASSSASGRTTAMRRSCRTTSRTVLLGAGLLWFGWFGFNAGSALAASPIAGLAFVTTMLAPAATLVVWTLPRHDALGQADGGRCCDGDRRRPGGDHAGGRVHQPDERDRCSARSRRCRATSR